MYCMYFNFTRHLAVNRAAALLNTKEMGSASLALAAQLRPGTASTSDVTMQLGAQNGNGETIMTAASLGVYGLELLNR